MSTVVSLTCAVEQIATFNEAPVEAVHELSKMNDAKDSVINSLDARISKLEAMMNAQPSSSVINNATINNSNAGVQIALNPFYKCCNYSIHIIKRFSSAK